MFRRATICLVIIFTISITSIGQETTPEPEITPEATEMSDDDAMCQALIAEAIQLTERSCDSTDTNEACYGFSFIDAQLRSQDAQFNVPGDIEPVTELQSVQLSAFDVQSGVWGLITLRVEANATLDPDNPDPPENDVQLVLYGDARLSDASQFIEVTTTSDVNVRELPRTDAPVVTSLSADEIVVANARLEDDSWFRVRLTLDNQVQNAWIAADFLATNFDPTTLTALTPEEAAQPADDTAAQYGPMQALILETGADDSPCQAAPNSGMLIQTPDGVASINLLLDEVVIQLDGTGLISAQADGNLTVGVLEGTAQVESMGGTSTAVAGQAIDVPLNEDLAPLDVPDAPRPLDLDEVQSVPTIVLDDPVTLPPIGEQSTVGAAGLSTNTDGLSWQFGYTTPGPFVCSDGSDVVLQTTGVPATIEQEADAIVISGVRFPEVSEGVYSVSYLDGENNLISDTVQVSGTDRLIGERVFDFDTPICTLTVSFIIQLRQ